MPLPDPELTTVVIPVRNEVHSIGACLESVVAQDLERLEVLVVDGASTDGTADIVRDVARRDDRVKLLHNDASNIPSSLNLALEAARGKWLVRVDAHATIPPHYVRAAVELLATNRWGGVGGRKEAVGATSAGRAIARAMASRFGVGNSYYHFGQEVRTVDHVPFGAYPMTLVRELGGWDESVPANEDFEFDYRMRRTGNELLFDPNLVISWQCRQSIPALFRQYLRYGRGKATVARFHPTSMRARHFLPPALVGAWAVALTYGRRHPKLLLAVVLPYVVTLSVSSVATARALPDSRARAWVPVVFPTMHFAWGLGFWQGAAKIIARELAAWGRQ